MFVFLPLSVPIGLNEVSLLFFHNITDSIKKLQKIFITHNMLKPPSKLLNVILCFDFYNTKIYCCFIWFRKNAWGWQKGFKAWKFIWKAFEEEEKLIAYWKWKFEAFSNEKVLISCLMFIKKLFENHVNLKANINAYDGALSHVSM